MKKIISFVSLLGLLLNSFLAPLSVIAQEATSSPTPETIISTEVTTPLPDLSVIDLTTPLPEETPTPVEESIPTPTDQVVVENVSSTETEPQVAEPSATLITPESQPVEKVYLSDGQIVIDTSNSEWNVEGNTAETKEPVRLGVKYVFPLETGVTLTFKSLPANESLHTTIKITKVKVSDLNFPDDMKPYGEYAYDITTGMVDGTFDYDLTLPKPNDQNVDVAYMEDKNSTPTALADNQTTQDGGTVRASNIDHFTIFVVINPAPTGPSCVLAGATTETGCYSTIQAAIDASVNGDVIEIESDILVGQMIVVNKDITINGNGFTISPTFTKTDNSNNAVFGITSSGVTISNLVIDSALGTNLHGINVYVSTGVLLDGVSVLNNGYAGIVVNGSIVTVNNIVTSGNGWGGINVDQGSGVTTEARLTVNGLSSHTEAVHIWIDDSRKNVSVVDTLDQYDITNSGHARIYTLNTSTSGNPSATLSQYANDAPTGWVNGNLGASKATYYEGNSIPYRMVMDNLSLASHSLTIEWDTTKSSKHAEDYLTSFDRTVSTADPCMGVSGCSTFSTFPIPVDPQVSGAGVTPVAGNFTLYGGTITGVSAYSYADGTGFVGDKSARITITFTPSVSNPVLAWGGHIADRKDWGANNSAISIPGSPYHMRLIDLDGSGGNQDRSLSADAVIFPATITVIKDAIPDSPQDFSFTTSGTELSNFSLDDDLDTTLSNIQIFSVTSFASNNGDTKTITEDPQSGWSLTGLVCNDNNGSTDLTARTATLSVVEGESITCTFTNTLKQGTIELKKVWVGTGGQTTLTIGTTPGGSGIDTQLTGQDGGAPLTTGQNSVNPGTYYLSESGGLDNYTASPLSCFNDLNNDGDNDNEPVVAVGENDSVVVAPDDHIICAYANTRKQGTIIVKKIMIGGTGSFNFTGTPNGTINDNEGIIQTTVNTGQYTSIETPLSGWELTDLTCSDSVDQNSFGDKDTGIATFNVEYNETVTCTFTNTKYGSISGFKYEDGNQTPLAGWVISLYEGTDLVATQSTTLSGYSFTNLLPGIYSLFEMLQDGWTAISSPPDVELEAGENDGPNNFVNFNYGRISGHKWNDLNGDSDWDIPEEPAIEGWTIYATYPDQSTHSTTTDSSGYYSFSDLGPGQYIVYETPPTGWAQTFPMSSYVINMTSGGDFENNDFGNQIRGTITIIKDAIPNSTQNFEFTSTQLGIFTLEDYDGGGKYINTEVLSDKGNGTYTITESLVSGWKLTDIVCEGDSDAQVDIDNRTATLTINEPGENITCTFTNTKYGFMQGRKYLDNNLNGRLDWAESGTFQDNWSIRLYDSGWQLKGEQLTGNGDLEKGQYKFKDLLPGEYYACEVLPAGWQQMGPVLGSHAVNYDNIQVNGSIAVINGSGVPGEGPVCWQSNINGDEFGWLGFGNIQKGHIIVDKVTDPSEDMQSFSFDATGNGYADFTLTDQDPPNDQELLPGIYTISEADVNGWELESASCISSIKDSESVSRLDLDPGETITCTFNNVKLDPDISITKSNNAGGGILAGATITYTLTLTNDGNTHIYDIDITDVIPGGFTYVLGSTTGATTSDPVVGSGILTWNSVGDLGIGESLTISYQTKTGTDLTNGNYTNYATCKANYGRMSEDEKSEIENIVSCNTADSVVSIGSTQGYSGNLVGQVLGISTELPATGNPTWVLIAAFAALGVGIFLNVYAKKKTKNVKE